MFGKCPWPVAPPGGRCETFDPACVSSNGTTVAETQSWPSTLPSLGERAVLSGMFRFLAGRSMKIMHARTGSPSPRTATVAPAVDAPARPSSERESWEEEEEESMTKEQMWEASVNKMSAADLDARRLQLRYNCLSASGRATVRTLAEQRNREGGCMDPQAEGWLAFSA